MCERDDKHIYLLVLVCASRVFAVLGLLLTYQDLFRATRNYCGDTMCRRIYQVGTAVVVVVVGEHCITGTVGGRDPVWA